MDSICRENWWKRWGLQRLLDGDDAAALVVVGWTVA
jgi:hypothetical protein